MPGITNQSNGTYSLIRSQQQEIEKDQCHGLFDEPHVSQSRPARSAHGALRSALQEDVQLRSQTSPREMWLGLGISLCQPVLLQTAQCNLEHSTSPLGENLNIFFVDLIYIELFGSSQRSMEMSILFIRYLCAGT
jgi:hypothetical protein